MPSKVLFQALVSCGVLLHALISNLQGRCEILLFFKQMKLYIPLLRASLGMVCNAFA